MVSSVFNVDPTVKSGRMGGDDDNVPTKPHQKPFKAPSAPQPVDISESRPALAELTRSPSGIAPALASPAIEVDQRAVEKILESLRVALRSRGAVGIRGLARNFQICDTDGSKKLDKTELTKCLRLCKLQLTEAEFDTLWNSVDADGSNMVDYEEFLSAVRGRLPPLRRKLIVSVFNAIDQAPRASGAGRSDGVVSADDLKQFYSAKEHPEVKAGKKSESAVLAEMLHNFEGKKGNRDGLVSLTEWVDYYEELSASVDNDDYFTVMVTAAWATMFDAKAMGGAEFALHKPVQARQIDDIEKRLIEAIRTRSSGANETRALETTFKQFDADKNGTIEFEEFRKAMERFGLATGPHPGCTVEVINALFDRYDPDGSGAISYDEFIKGVFKLNAPPTSARAAGADLGSGVGTSLPLPSDRGGADPNASFARGRGGVYGFKMNSGTATGSGQQSARAGPGGGFNQSSGIFR